MNILDDIRFAEKFMTLAIDSGMIQYTPPDFLFDQLEVMLTGQGILKVGFVEPISRNMVQVIRTYPAEESHNIVYLLCREHAPSSHGIASFALQERADFGHMINALAVYGFDLRQCYQASLYLD